jgi:hypothetical protein
MKRTIKESIQDLEVIRSALCSYRSRHGKKCDCKFGVKHIKGQKYPALSSGENGCGCPELYEAMHHLRAYLKIMEAENE